MFEKTEHNGHESKSGVSVINTKFEEIQKQRVLLE